MAEFCIIKYWQIDMAKKDKTFLKKIWIWLRTDQGLTIAQAEKAMNLDVEEFDALIDMELS